MNYRLILFAATFVFLVVFSAQLVPHSASAQKPKQDPRFLERSSFRPDNRANLNSYVLSDGDVIMMTVEDDKGIAQDEIEIVLKTDPNVTWWKSIIVKDFNGGKQTRVNSISTQDDDHGPKAMRQNFANVVADQEDGHFFWLVFAKAKVLGVHTEMYDLGWGRLQESLSDLKGKRVIFTWQKD